MAERQSTVTAADVKGRNLRKPASWYNEPPDQVTLEKMYVESILAERQAVKRWYLYMA